MVTDTTRRDAIIIIEVRACNPPSSRSRSEASSSRASVAAGSTITVTSRSLGSLRLGRRPKRRRAAQGPRQPARPSRCADQRSELATCRLSPKPLVHEGFSPSSMIGSDRCVGFPSSPASSASPSRSPPPEVHVDGLHRGARFLLANQGRRRALARLRNAGGRGVAVADGVRRHRPAVGRDRARRPRPSGRHAGGGTARRRRLGLQRGRAERRRLDGVGAALPRPHRAATSAPAIVRPADSSATSAPAAAASPPTPSPGRSAATWAWAGGCPSGGGVVRTSRSAPSALVHWPAVTMRRPMRPGGSCARSSTPPVPGARTGGPHRTTPRRRRWSSPAAGTTGQPSSGLPRGRSGPTTPARRSPRR